MQRLWLYICVCVLSFVLNGDWNARGPMGSRVDYLSFQGDKYKLYVWEGKYMSLLTPSKDLDSLTINKILAIADSGYSFLKGMTNREPLEPYNNGNSKTKIAIVDYSCGIGCGFLGHKGIEITEDKFMRMYKVMKEEGRFDTLLFYELGRNFWFYNKQLYTEHSSPRVKALRKGFAIFTRHLLAEELCVRPSPLNGQVFNEYSKETYLLFFQYHRVGSLGFQHFLKDDIQFRKFLLKNKLRTSSISSRFWASFLLYIYGHPSYGLPFIHELLMQFEQSPPAKNGDEVLVNFVNAFERINSDADSQWIRNLFLND